mmetsp:Transcript_22024/g.30845  ORF Transcript_22024/g.30845 Transcript_22024/m.30845 type:complete len:293 (+) Transcript_22024:67-945(+)
MMRFLLPFWVLILPLNLVTPLVEWRQQSRMLPQIANGRIVYMRQGSFVPRTKKHRLQLPTQEKIGQSVRTLEMLGMARGTITGPEAGVPDCPDLVLFDLNGLALSHDDGRVDAALVEDTRSGIILLIDLLQSNFVRVGFFSSEAESLKESIKLLAEETGNPDIANEVGFFSIKRGKHGNNQEVIESSINAYISSLSTPPSPKVLLLVSNNLSFLRVAGVANIAGSNTISTCLLRPYSEDPYTGEEMEEGEGETAKVARATMTSSTAERPTYEVGSLFELRALLTCQIGATWK